MGNDLFDSPLYQSKRQSNKPLEEQSLEKKEQHPIVQGLINVWNELMKIQANSMGNVVNEGYRDVQKNLIKRRAKKIREQRDEILRTGTPAQKDSVAWRDVFDYFLERNPKIFGR